MIHASVDLALAVEEVAGRDAVQEVAAAEMAKRFDLEAGPLVRARLLRLSPEEHVLLVTLHHIVSDAWTRRVLLRELGALYEAFQAGRSSPLGEPPVRAADYAVWQRRGWLRGDVLVTSSSSTGRSSSPARLPRSICPRIGRGRRCSRDAARGGASRSPRKRGAGSWICRAARTRQALP